MKEGSQSDRHYDENEAETSLSVHGRVLVIHFRKDVDHHLASTIREKADRLLERENIRDIVFDFEGVGFMDSSGIGVIMGRYKKVIFSGGKAVVCGIGEGVDRVLSMSGLYKILPRFEHEADCLRYLRGGNG